MSLRRGPVNQFSALSTIFAALFSLSAIGFVGCTKNEPPPPPPKQPWSIATGAIHKARDGVNPERCNPEGKECKPLVAGETFAGEGLVKTGADSRVLLQLDEATSIELLENAAVKLVHDGDGAVSVEAGSIVVHHEGAGKGKAYLLRLPGTVATWPLDRDETFAVRMVSEAGAVVTARRGLVSLKSEKNESLEVRSGETARLSKDKAPDKRGVWAGIESPVEYSEEVRTVEPLPAAAARGFGAMTARVPGTGETIQGVRLASHKVQVVVRDGFARTEIEEEFFNETAQVLEGRYMFPLPADASISRLALWVGKDLVEGEVLEKDRAKIIFQQIVDDTVRPRDPALLEWVSGSEFSLKIFPIPAKGSRKVVLAYNQILPSDAGRVRYVYPLSLGPDRATKINEFSVSVRATSSDGAVNDLMTPGYSATMATNEGKASVDYQAKDFVPNDDFVVSFRSGNTGVVRAATYTPKEGEFRDTSKSATTPAPAKGIGADNGVAAQETYVALRFEAALPTDAPLPERTRRDLVLVIDTSHSQSRETLDRTVKLASGLLRQMDPDEKFAVLACDSACVPWPAQGFVSASLDSIEGAEKWMRTKTPGGSSDISGSLLAAAERLESVGKGQLIYLGDGSPTSGELNVETISSRILPKINPEKFDLRFLGTGRTVDDVTLSGLARTFGGTYDRVQTGDHLEQRIAEIGLGLRAPVLRWVVPVLPDGIKDVYPRQLPHVRLGQELTLFGKMTGPLRGDVVLRGNLGATKYELRRPLNTVAAAAGDTEKGNALVPRLWAESRIRELETSDSQGLIKETVDLSKRFHVMSRHTSFLVLESEKMFAEFGVERTTRKATDQSDDSFAGLPDGTPPAAGPAATATAAGGAAPPPPFMPAPVAKSAPRSMDMGFDSNGPAPSMPRAKPGGWGRRWVQVRNVTHSLDKADWNKAGDDEVQKLRAAVNEAQQSRRKRTELIRGLMQRGRFDDAFVEAQRFADSDPDQSEAHQLVAYAAAALGNMQQAVLEMDTQTEILPRRGLSHSLAARALEAAGDERRACAHWRTAAELDKKSDDLLTEAFRCRARVFDGREVALHDAKGIDKPGPKLKKLIEAFEKNESPAFAAQSGGYLFRASVQCAGAAPSTLPHLIIINHLGNIISPWTPTAAATGPGFAAISFSMPQGTYRTIVWGTDGAQCELTVDSEGTSKKFPITSGPLVVKTVVEMSGRWEGGGGGWRGYVDL